MSYLEHNVKSVPTGIKKIFYLNWPLALLLASVAGIGFLMLYSVAGRSFSPWAEPQMKRFALGFTRFAYRHLVDGFFPRLRPNFNGDRTFFIGGRIERICQSQIKKK